MYGTVMSSPFTVAWHLVTKSVLAQLVKRKQTRRELHSWHVPTAAVQKIFLFSDQLRDRVVL